MVGIPGGTSCVRASFPAEVLMVLGGREVVWLEQKDGMEGLGDPLGAMEYIQV